MWCLLLIFLALNLMCSKATIPPEDLQMRAKYDSPEISSEEEAKELACQVMEQISEQNEIIGPLRRFAPAQLFDHDRSTVECTIEAMRQQNEEMQQDEIVVSSPNRDNNNSPKKEKRKKLKQYATAIVHKSGDGYRVTVYMVSMLPALVGGLLCGMGMGAAGCLSGCLSCIFRCSCAMDRNPALMGYEWGRMGAILGARIGAMIVEVPLTAGHKHHGGRKFQRRIGFWN